MITVTQVHDLNVLLATWQGRDHDDTTPLQRQAADLAVDAIDVMLQALYLLRGRTVSERRECDDLRAVRLEALRGPQVPAQQMAIIDAVLPREQAHERWLANREDMRQ